MKPRPFRSKLIPHVEQIIKWRREDKTWQQIANDLAELGCVSNPGNICRFVDRFKRRPYARGAEPLTEKVPNIVRPLTKEIKQTWEEKKQNNQIKGFAVRE
jgi:hypothetical protein